MGSYLSHLPAEIVRFSSFITKFRCFPFFALQVCVCVFGSQGKVGATLVPRKQTVTRACLIKLFVTKNPLD